LFYLEAKVEESLVLALLRGASKSLLRWLPCLKRRPSENLYSCNTSLVSEAASRKLVREGAKISSKIAVSLTDNSQKDSLKTHRPAPLKVLLTASLAQSDRATVFETVGYWFESNRRTLLIKKTPTDKTQ
ncbi:3600_t:CDS:2, partial [Dentiscutata heterogama]